MHTGNNLNLLATDQDSMMYHNAFFSVVLLNENLGKFLPLHTMDGRHLCLLHLKNVDFGKLCLFENNGGERFDGLGA